MQTFAEGRSFKLAITTETGKQLCQKNQALEMGGCFRLTWPHMPQIRRHQLHEQNISFIEEAAGFQQSLRASQRWGVVSDYPPCTMLLPHGHCAVGAAATQQQHAVGSINTTGFVGGASFTPAFELNLCVDLQERPIRCKTKRRISKTGDVSL